MKRYQANSSRRTSQIELSGNNWLCKKINPTTIGSVPKIAEIIEMNPKFSTNKKN